MATTNEPFSVDVVDFINGKVTVPPERLSSAEWAKVIRSEVQSLLPFLPAIESARSIVRHLNEGVGEGQRFFQSSVIETKLNWEIMRGMQFILCASLGIRPHRTWREATEDGKKELTDYDSTHLFVSTLEGKFFLMRVTWKPREIWDEGGGQSYPDAFFYEAISAKIWFAENQDLMAFLEEDEPLTPVPILILLALNRASREEQSDCQSRLRVISRKIRRSAARLARLGYDLS